MDAGGYEDVLPSLEERCALLVRRGVHDSGFLQEASLQLWVLVAGGFGRVRRLREGDLIDLSVFVAVGEYFAVEKEAAPSLFSNLRLESIEVVLVMSVAPRVGE